MKSLGSVGTKWAVSIQSANKLVGGFKEAKRNHTRKDRQVITKLFEVIVTHYNYSLNQELLGSRGLESKETLP